MSTSFYVLGFGFLPYLLVVVVVATTPMGRVRRAAARGRPYARDEHESLLGWLVVLLVGGPAIPFVGIMVLLVSSSGLEFLFRATPFAVFGSLFLTCPALLLLGTRLTAESARGVGSPRCPVRCSWMSRCSW